MWLRKSSNIYAYFMGFITTLIISFLLTNIANLIALWSQKPKEGNILKIINCTNKPMTRAIKRRNNYWVFYNFVQADTKFSCDQSITYTTSATYTFLNNLPSLVKVWKGPISVALYAPGEDFHTSLKSIAYLRHCETLLIKQLVTFHIIFDDNHFPFEYDSSLMTAYDHIYSCKNDAPFKNVTYEDTYRAKYKLIFPISVARNVARQAAQTHFVLSLDIELYPTPNFIEKFLKMVVNKKNLFTDSKPKVFVLPVFEILVNQIIPTNKTQLQKMFKLNKAFYFHENISSNCHELINGTDWLQAPETEGLDVFAIGKRQNEEYKYWEPFYVGTNNEPWFYERLTWERSFDKMFQAYVLCMLDYDFVVLNNAFLTQRPGVKKQKDEIILLNELDPKEKWLLEINDVKNQLSKMYGSNTDCTVLFDLQC